MNPTPFTPITKESAAQILSVSVRTIDYYVQDGRMPAPVHLGRRAYWHPDVFFAWLHRALGAPEAAAAGADAPADSADSVPEPAPQQREPIVEPAAPRPTPKVSPKRGNSGPGYAARSPLATRVQKRDAALLASLNGSGHDGDELH